MYRTATRNIEVEVTPRFLPQMDIAFVNPKIYIYERIQ